jgi:hypothetical protein
MAGQPATHQLAGFLERRTTGRTGGSAAFGFVETRAAAMEGAHPLCSREMIDLKDVEECQWRCVYAFDL